MAAQVNLHIAHSWGGGLTKWVDEFVAHDRAAENLVLRSHGGLSAYGLEFRLSGGGADEHRVLESPIATTAIAHAEYRELLEGVIRRHGVTRVIVSSLIGHSLDALDLSVPTIVVFHDYFPFCVAINPFFGEVCTSCNIERLTRCLDENRLTQRMRVSGPTHWAEVRRAYLAAIGRPGLRFVSPSRALASHLASLDPAFAALDITVIRHGIEPGAEDAFGGASDGRRLRVAMIGRLKAKKVVSRLIDRIRLIADIQMIGAGDAANGFAAMTGVTVTPPYRSDELTRILTDLRPDLALLIVEQPETFSYVLSEAWAHGLPVVAPAVGSFAERIQSGKDGFLVEDMSEVVPLLLAIDADRGILRAMHRRVLERPVRLIDEMLTDYAGLEGVATPVASAQ